jgi:hypothetical protein
LEGRGSLPLAADKKPYEEKAAKDKARYEAEKVALKE